MNMHFIFRLAVIASVLLASAIPVTLQAQVTGDAQITILQTTDLHDHANGGEHTGLDVDPATGLGTTGGYARISGYVNYVRASAGHPVILVDSGDWTMGTFYDLTLSSRPLALSFLDLMRYDCVTLGNHEFDYTPRGLAQILGAAQSSFGFRTPIVASNLNAGSSTDLAPFVGDGKAIQTTRVQQLANGLKVGYIGLMGKAAAADAPASTPVTFTDFSADYAQIQNLVNGLRNSAGVHVVVVLSHSGTNASGTAGEDVELARHVTGIDVIASGHTHTPLPSARTVTNGNRSTWIIDAGVFGANVSRLDLTWHSSTNSTTLDASGNPAMTNAGLAAVQPGLVPDAAIAQAVAAVDRQLNVTLSPFLTQVFADFDPANPGKGVYHAVGSAAQNMVSNYNNPIPSPNGLGNLTADAVRSIPNSILVQTLAAAGGNPANLPTFDFTPFQAGVVATGVIRGTLQTGIPITFADIYNVLPLGISPDTSQALPVGYPLVSSYLDLADLKKLCALQLVAQTNLVPPDYYLNISGLRYGLKTTEGYLYFKYATAAAILQTASQQAASGSVPALRAFGALSSLASDGGAALLGAYGNDNPWAGAMVQLNDVNPSFAQIMTNLGALGQVAAAGAAGVAPRSALVVSKAVAAIDTVAGFAPSDSSNTGPAVELSGTARVRVATDLYAVLALDTVQTQFGITITVYKSATGTSALSGGDLGGILANRISSGPPTGPVQELKGWMALLSYVGTGLRGNIGSAYASSPAFSQFGTSGAAVQTRNASYPIAAIAQYAGALAALQGAPSCALSGTPPVIAAVTNESYGSSLSSSGTIVVWGTGFSGGGGNALVFNRPGLADPITISASTGSYFWDLSPNQMNAAIGGRIAAGQWMVSVRNACGAASTASLVSIQ